MNERPFANAAELQQAILQEQPGSDRFRVQFILVSGLGAWRDVLDTLSVECVVFRISELCRGEDILPHLGDLRTRLDALTAQRALLVPLGEMLQLDPNNVPLIDLAQWQQTGAKRIYVPVLERRDLVTTALERVGRYVAGECTVWTLSGTGRVDVHAVPFQLVNPAAKVVHGVRAYLELWEQGGAEQVQLVSMWAPTWSQVARVGAFRFRVSADAHAALCAQIPDAAVLEARWGTSDEWQWLASSARPGEGFVSLAGRLLNIAHADVQGVASAWPQYDEHERWLAWLWARWMRSDQSFFDSVVRCAARSSEVVTTASMVPLEATLSLQHLAERRRFLKLLLGESELPGAWWARLEATPDPLLRLQAIPGFTERQQERILLEVRDLITRKADPQQWLPIVRLTFPALAAYLTECPLSDEFLQQYMRLYAESRVLDTAGPALLKLGSEWAEKKLLWEYRTRAATLAQTAPMGSELVWVDALGIEWAGLLHRWLNDDTIECRVETGRAQLPTSTSSNREWQDNETVERGLDNIAHEHGYSFPRSLVRELRLVSEIAARIRDACEDAPTVVVTGDHGLTRFAASGDRIELPAGWTAHKWGRYAYSTGQPPQAPANSDQWLSTDNCLMLARHGLFTGGARTGGEVHGGALPEEALVPILVVQKRRRERPVARLVDSRTRPDSKGECRLAFSVSQPVQGIQLTVGLFGWQGKRLEGGRWEVVLEGIRPGRYQSYLRYEGGYLGEFEFEVLPRGISHDDMGLALKEQP